ncbi:MAG: rRNA pseudouridine synthase [Saprospiraceae bacterium]|nr:rRNA pseudouridine synthase [Saprospiraceae bacterium]
MEHRKKNQDKKRSNSKSFRPKRTASSNTQMDVEGMRLNKYVAHCGVCSRRQAADFVKNGDVTVNGAVIKEPFYQVQKGDKIQFKGKPIKPEGRKVYILMNKPKDFITTRSDEKGRKTVMDLLKGKIEERIFPVGRLDRATTWLLLLTNDGDLAEKLAHPSHKVKKVYYVILNRPLVKVDLEKIQKGVELEDGIAEVDGIDYVAGAPKSEVGIEIHLGKNRIVRRIFEHLGYEVEKLDRVYYAGLTKKDLPRGFWRHLTEKEIIMLKHFT